MRWRAAITFPCRAEKTLLEMGCIRTEAGDPNSCALGPQTQHDYVHNVSIQRKLTLGALNGIGSKVPNFAVSVSGAAWALEPESEHE